VIAPDELLTESTGLVSVADSRGAPLRLLGSAATFANPTTRRYLERMHEGRVTLKDIDLVGLRKFAKVYEEIFEQRDYEVDGDLLLTAEGTRYAFYRGELQVDLFLDRMDMCHSLDLRRRISLTELCLNPSDLLLLKLQIVDLLPKDVREVIAILLTYECGTSDDRLDLPYIQELLGNDWGFHYTVLQNCDQVAESLETAELDEADRRVALDRLLELRTAIEEGHKTRRWKNRALIGPRKRWYQHVEDRGEVL
jgi:hypothetical protein